MSVLLNVTTGVPGASDAFSDFMAGPFGLENPALSIPYDSQIGWILTLVAGGMFLLEALFAASNLFREAYFVHFWIVVACLERVATMVFRAILYKEQEVVWVKTFEILEAIGTALIISAAYQLFCGFVRSRKVGRSCCASSWSALTVFVASLAVSAGSGLFAAGAWLQDGGASTQSRFDRGFSFRQYSVVVYGAVISVYLIMSSFAICFRGRRGIAIQLWFIGAALGAKAGFQIYALWTGDQPLGVQRYYSNRFYFTLLVFPELLAVSLMTSRTFVGRALKPGNSPLPFSYPLQGDPHNPNLPHYQPHTHYHPQQQQQPEGQYGAFFGAGTYPARNSYAPRGSTSPKRGAPPAELAKLQQGSLS